MIQKGLHIMERLHRLLDLHERMQQPCFTHLIEPMYRDAEDIVRDYTSLHLDLIEQLYTHSEAAAVITWLEVHRMKCLPLYMLVRNVEPEAQIESQYGRHPIVAFQNNMLSLMQRCLFLVEQEKLRFAAHSHHELSFLTQLYLNYHEPLPRHRPFYVEMAKQQWQAVQAIWEEVVACYAVIKLQYHEAALQVSCTPGSLCSTPLDGSAGA